MQRGTAQWRDMDPLSSLNSHRCFVKHIILGFSLMHVLCKASSLTAQSKSMASSKVDVSLNVENVSDVTKKAVSHCLCLNRPAKDNFASQ